MRVASIALAAYLVISAEAASITNTWLPCAHEGRVELAQHPGGTFVLDPEDYPVGLPEVVHGCSLLQELRGSSKHEPRGRSPPRLPPGHGALSPPGTVLLVITMRSPVNRTAYLAGRGQDVLQVGGAVLIGRGAHRDEDHERTADGVLQIGREREPPGCQAVSYEGVQTGFEEGEVAPPSGARSAPPACRHR